MARKNEKGVALILVLILLLVLSVMAVSLLFVGQSETWASMNYRMMTQARYGAEAGINSAANFLQSTSYTAPTSAQIAANFTITSSPVKYGQLPAVLSANSSLGSSNYPIASDATGFAASASGSITSGNTTITYSPYAKLLAIQSFASYPSTAPAVVEKWEITSDGTISGVRNGQVRASAIMERQKTPTFAYAAFADASTCGALSFGGGGSTDGYDSSTLSSSGGVATAPSTFSTFGGNVGTNGNLSESGATTTINGTLSSPRAGTGTCSSSTMTALTVNGNSTVTGGLVELPQPVTYNTPPAPTPAPPQVPMTVGNNVNCTAFPTGSCTVGGYDKNGNNPSIMYLTAGTSSTSALQLGDVTIQGNLHLVPPAGTTAGSTVYINADSITANGNPTLTIDPIPGTNPPQYAQIVLNVAPTGSIDLTGSSLSNPSLVPADFQILYGGTSQVKINGGSQAAALIYAPNASFKLNGGGSLYGSVIANQVTDLGGGSIHYDRNLKVGFYQLGNYMLSSFNWQKY
jgi:Tfp pilus assembly protein PilX